MSDFDFEQKAKKALGNGGKLPKPPADPRAALQLANKSTEALQRGIDTFKKGTGDLEKQLLDCQNKLTAFKNTLNQYKNVVDGSDFDLDEDKPDDKKKIGEAKKIMNQGLDQDVAKVDVILRDLSHVDQVLSHLQRLDKVKIC